MQIEKQKAAAVAAVMAYLKTEEEVAAAGAAAAQATAQPTAATVQVGMWGLSGRQAMMQTRSLMQMKGFHGVRCR
jgi:hypothetical protein